MRPKAELTEDAQREIERVLENMRADDPQTRLRATEQSRRLKLLYGAETLQAVEEEYGERKRQEAYDEHGSSGVIYD